MKGWLFVTLTYPAVWPEEPKAWKEQLALFWKRYRYKFPQASAVWKLETQRRGAPHYHLIVLHPARVPGLKEHRRYVAQAWYEVVGSGDQRHYRAGTAVERVLGERQAVSYASKYLGKSCDFLDQATGELRPVGRYWGVLGRKSLVVDRVVVPMSDQEYFRLRRVARRIWARLPNTEAPQGFALHMDGESFARLVRWATGAPVIDYRGNGVDATEGS